MVFTFHSIFNKEVDDHWYDDISEEHLSTFIDDVKSYQNNTWITTFANTVRYHKEAQCSVISMIEENEAFIFLEVSNDLPLEPYNVPLRLRLDGINYVSIIQGNKELPMVLEGNSTLVDVIPNQRKIQIQKQK